MPFSYMDHTGDVGIELDSTSLEGLLADAALAFTDILTDPSLIEVQESVDLYIQAPDPTELLHLWLEELLFLFDTRGLLAAPTAMTLQLGDEGTYQLRSVLEGEEIDLARHPQRVQIKAVTYHCLEVRRQADRWLGTVVFDI